MQPTHTNRLAREKSPYLLQYAHNPVDWHAWGGEAFEKAKKEDKPIFLSIGYSTCHWCHVMERESFESADVAQVLNENFISVKVDREERPDIDTVYMNYVMATTGGGGWPMSVFITPEGKPFYGGTYFPPTDRYGMPGFKTLLLSIADAWKTRRHEITASADQAAAFLSSSKEAADARELSTAVLQAAYQNYLDSYDAEKGGFGHAPKFPRPHSLTFLLRYWKRSGTGQALEMALSTLAAMARGGMNDQLGGGFHRYSTDRDWHVPHFEKMLYDQALLVPAYLEAYQVSGNSNFAEVARQTLDYVLREMTSPEGGFYSAQDADSVSPENPSEKKEGAYFVWSRAEIVKVLGEKDSAFFAEHYGVKPDGNAASDPHGEFTGQNILYRAKQTDPATEKELARMRAVLLKKRETRPKPHLDDKILTDWNSLMISAFAAASRVLAEEKYRAAAKKAAQFILTKLKTKKGTLLHRYRAGDAAIEGHLDDHAFFLAALLDLYEATFDAAWLDEAKGIAARMAENFWDAESGGFYFTSHTAEKLVSRPKEIYDGAVPSGNSVAALALLRLWRMTGEGQWEEKARQTLESFSGQVSQNPTAFPKMLTALDMAIGPSAEIVIAGPEDPMEKAALQKIYSKFLPNKVLMRRPAKDREYPAVGGKLTVYVCKDFKCQLPVTESAGLDKMLEEANKGANPR
jgi:uncharacterized protein YyaL (SSP411 family)